MYAFFFGGVHTSDFAKKHWMCRPKLSSSSGWAKSKSMFSAVRWKFFATHFCERYYHRCHDETISSPLSKSDVFRTCSQSLVQTFFVACPNIFCSLSNYFLIVISLFIVAFNSSILPAENLLLARFSPQKHQSLVYGIKFIVSFAIAPIALFLIATSYEVTREFSYLYLSCGVMMIVLFLIVLYLPSSKKFEIDSMI